MNEKIINSEQSLAAYKMFLDSQFEKNKYLRVSLKTGRQRTQTQNAALHVFLKLLAEELNAGGIDFRLFIKDGYPIPFNGTLVKECIWRPIQAAITGHDSTTKPKTNEYAIIYDALNLKLIEHEIFVPWPTKDGRG